MIFGIRDNIYNIINIEKIGSVPGVLRDRIINFWVKAKGNQTRQQYVVRPS